ncbi:hypothetical protein [Fundidesulfovibrio soli]|uniref:hypothetical protein n=1 Tax=Fundidesulfovibrio soli TaxID=2922716 RepID=UPI001FAE8D77|nr:hypothetical protein [Fundidesulfovibrio soli]
MNAVDALTTVNTALQKVKNDPNIAVSMDTDMLHDKILDSLDCLMLLMELDELCGFSVPEDIDLVAGGYFKVDKLISLLADKE